MTVYFRIIFLFLLIVTPYPEVKGKSPTPTAIEHIDGLLSCCNVVTDLAYPKCLCCSLTRKMHFQQCALVTLSTYMMGKKRRHLCSHGSYGYNSNQHQFLWLDHDRVMLKHGQVSQGQQPTLTIPRLPWVEGNPKMARRVPGWVGFHHPVGLGWRARSG